MAKEEMERRVAEVFEAGDREELIHAYARVMTYLSGVVFLVTVGWIVWVHGLPPDFLIRNSLTASGFLGTVSTAALWQIAYAPYVSDYSRYMPRDT